MIGMSGIGNTYMYTNPYNSNYSQTDKTQGAQGVECETCQNRQYVDGSNEMVSFKTPGKISPGESYAKVMSHEKEHVANAVAEGKKANKELVSVSVSLKTSTCPECGRSYVSGGTTRTTMKTYNSDPYSQNKKSYEQESLKGNNIDYTI